MIKLSAAFRGKNAYDVIVTISQNERQRSLNGASSEPQQFLILHLGKSNGNGTQISHNEPIGSHYWQKC